jgi:hypothetical protein
MSPHPEKRTFHPHRRSAVLAVVLYGLLIAAYFVFRYGGQSVDGDTAFLTAAIRRMQTEGTLVPSEEVYGAGFLYPAFSVVVLAFSGGSVLQLQLFVYPFVAAVLIFASAYALYHAMLPSARQALLATFLLFLLPEFLFHIFRGSHEKLTWTLTLAAFLLLVKSTTAKNLRAFGLYVLLFYLVAFALVTVNAFIAFSFIAAMFFAFLAGLLLRFLRSPATLAFSSASRRFLYVTFSCSVLAFVFIFYLYAPAEDIVLRSLQSSVDQVAALVLSFEPQQAGVPYAVIGSDWISPQVYLGLTLFNWVVLLVSLTEWAWRGWRYLFRREQPTAPAMLLWILYATFAVQFGLSVVLDQAGVLGGNLQLRILLPLYVLAVPLLSSAVFRLLDLLPAVGWKRFLVTTAFVLLVLWFAGASGLKATNDPLVSNNWFFYASKEKDGVLWLEDHAQVADIWEGPDVRLRALRDMDLAGERTLSNRYWAVWISDATQ